MTNKRHASTFLRLLLLMLLYGITISVVFFAITSSNVPANSDSLLNNARFILLLILAPIFLKYAIQLLAIPFYWLKTRGVNKQALLQDKPSVSVLIPAWNEEVGIIRTIQSVLNTGYQQLELVVINDGSTDATHRLITQFIQHYQAQEHSPVNIIYLDLENGGKAKALNQALSQANGEIILTIDADCLMDSDAIDNTVKHFIDDNVGAVAGNVVIGNRTKSIELLQQLEYLYGFFFRRADSVFNSVYIIGGAAAAYRKSVLDKIGGFDHKILTEDIEMSIRILDAGFSTRYAADAITYTEGPGDWKGLCEQRLRWKFGRFQTFIKYKQLFFSVAKQHNTYCTWLLLPIAVYVELTLLLQGVFLAFFYGYTFYTQDYLPLLMMICFMTSMVTLQILCDAKTRFHANLIMLAPIAWLILYVVDAVEFHALCRSIKRMVKQEQLTWQKWTRAGLLSESLIEAEDEDAFN